MSVNKDDANDKLLRRAKYLSSFRKVPDSEKAALIDIASSLRSISGALAALVGGEKGILRKGDRR